MLCAKLYHLIYKMLISNARLRNKSALPRMRRGALVNARLSLSLSLGAVHSTVSGLRSGLYRVFRHLK